MRNSRLGVLGLLVVSVQALAAAGCGGGGGDDDGVDRIPASYTITEPSLLVAVGNAGTLRVLKQSDLSITATVTLRAGLRPHALELSPDKTLLSVSQLAPLDVGGGKPPPPGELLVLDARTGQEKASIKTPGSTENALLMAGGKLVFAERSTGMLHFGRLVEGSFDIATEADLAVCATPMHTTLTRDNARILVACDDADTLAIVDAVSRAKIEIAVGDRPLAAWIGDAGKYYVANQGSKDLSVGAIGQTPTPMALGYTPGMVAPSPDGTEFAVADREGGRIMIYRTVNQLEIATLAVAAGTFAIVWAPDGKKLWVTNESAGTVSQLSHPQAFTLMLDNSVEVGPGAYGLVAIQ